MIVTYIFIFQLSSYDSDEDTERTYNSVYIEICKLYFTLNLFSWRLAKSDSVVNRLYLFL